MGLESLAMLADPEMDWRGWIDVTSFILRVAPQMDPVQSRNLDWGLESTCRDGPGREKPSSTSQSLSKNVIID